MEPVFSMRRFTREEYSNWLRSITAAIPAEWPNRAPCTVVVSRGVSSRLAAYRGDLCGKMRSLQENEAAAILEVHWGPDAGMLFVEPPGSVWPYTVVTASLPDEGTDGCD